MVEEGVPEETLQVLKEELNPFLMGSLRNTRTAITQSELEQMCRVQISWSEDALQLVTFWKVLELEKRVDRIDSKVADIGFAIDRQMDCLRGYVDFGFAC